MLIKDAIIAIEKPDPNSFHTPYSLSNKKLSFKPIVDQDDRPLVVDHYRKYSLHDYSHS